MKNDKKNVGSKIENDTSKGRRKTLKSILVGTGALGAAASSEWKKPVIDHILLPSHATTSIGSGDDGGMGAPS